MASSEKVLIIGAGLGGLTLAQALRGKGIPFEIFERDVVNDLGRRAGWAVGLVECLSDLAELMPSDLLDMGDLRTLSVNHGNPQEDYLTLVDSVSGKPLVKIGGQSFGEPGYVLRASRGKARDYFWQHLDIRTGKVFTHYTEDADGVTVHFRDGTSARGTVLVGADGAHSKVRAQLLQQPNDRLLVPSRWIPIVGEADLPRSVYTRLHELGSAGVLANSDELRYMTGLRSMAADGESAKYYFTVNFPAEDPIAGAAWAKSSDAKTLHAKALELSKDLPEWLTNPIRHTGEEGMVMPPIALVEFVPPEELPKGRVTLLGDAAHTMVPFRGMGANSAIRDAADLTRRFVEAREKGLGVDWVLGEYEKIMVPRGREVVLTSRAAGESAAVATKAAQTRAVPTY